MSAGKNRIFDGKQFTLEREVSRKSDAEDIWAKIRQYDNRKARIVRTSYGYAIYTGGILRK